uniref:Pleckstrin homology domain-containing family G member 7 n=1 Tax=Geotrypetes seraphini TaxID=260995 RepID=A0A6P8RV55_GEOSA|nr:pleckstrin homology domain-containing family G member 7 [Geotrypetes seraphini]XP_033809394.1 pleckstrin homology domain-containing family G member 7 [Geotrypetes seraphini]XP_033809395.1 pleckstrin homology domain-containing family G member 7 [Geotrypetes seraphini]
MDLDGKNDPPENEADALDSGQPESVLSKGTDAKALSIYVKRVGLPNIPVKMKDFSGAPLLLKIPPEELEVYNTPFQFDRLAAGRISTSPTLRRLRKNTASQPLALQEFFSEAGFENQLHQTAETRTASQSWESPPWSPKYLSLPPQPSPLCMTSTAEQIEPEKEQASASSRCSNNKDTNHDSDAVLDERSSSCSEHGHLRKPSQEKDAEQVINPLDDCDQRRKFLDSRASERRRSSVVVNLDKFEVFPGDLLVSDGAADYLRYSTLFLNAETKKAKWPFSKKGSTRDKHKQLSDLESCLQAFKISDFREYEFRSLKDKTWYEFLQSQNVEKRATSDEKVLKQQEAVWELFTSECVYFLDHLLVLKMVFMNTLKYLQNNEHLLDVDLWRLFANLEELRQVSLSFIISLLNSMKNQWTDSEPPSSYTITSTLTKYFKGILCQRHQLFCLNYTSAIFYLESLKSREDFGVYLKWCEHHEPCQRLHLSDLLVAPLQRFTRYPLLMKNIWKRSTEATEKVTVFSIKENVDTSIRELEGKVKWLDNSQKFKQLQEIIVWPSLWKRDKRFFIPEYLKHLLKENIGENVLSSTNRHLLHEGRLTLAESTRLLDVYLFLFDDFLLITKIKRNKKKLGGAETGPTSPSLAPALQALIKEGGFCKVIDQPIPLDRLMLKNIDPLHVTVYGLQHAFLIQHENRYQQCIAVFLLQAHTEAMKKIWMSQIETAISSYTETYENKRSSIFCLSTESTEI